MTAKPSDEYRFVEFENACHNLHVDKKRLFYIRHETQDLTQIKNFFFSMQGYLYYFLAIEQFSVII